MENEADGERMQNQVLLQKTRVLILMKILSNSMKTV